jgi:hypothetical protein
MFFGHTSEKRTRSQPWLLDAKDCMNQPSEDSVIEDLKESERRRKNDEITFPTIFPANHHHMRRQYRLTTTRAPPPWEEKSKSDHTRDSCTYALT